VRRQKSGSDTFAYGQRHTDCLSLPAADEASLDSVKGAPAARGRAAPAAASAPTPAVRARNFLRENKFMYRYHAGGIAIE
jgi:hypothetical protein